MTLRIWGAGSTGRGAAGGGGALSAFGTGGATAGAGGATAGLGKDSITGAGSVPGWDTAGSGAIGSDGRLRLRLGAGSGGAFFGGGVTPIGCERRGTGGSGRVGSGPGREGGRMFVDSAC